MEHISDIDRQANELYATLVKQLSEKENVTEHLKVENKTERVRRMNSIRNRALETVQLDIAI